MKTKTNKPPVTGKELAEIVHRQAERIRWLEAQLAMNANEPAPKLTKRELLAAMAMQGLLASGKFTNLDDDGEFQEVISGRFSDELAAEIGTKWFMPVVDESIRVADKLLAELGKERK